MSLDHSRPRFVFVLMFLLFPCAAMPRSASAQLTDSTLQRIIRERGESTRMAGIVLGVVDGNGKRTVVSWQRSQEHGRRLDAATEFEIGSITKVFTGILLAEMVQRGEVNLDDPLSNYVPEGVSVPEHNGHPITLEDLATHFSGLPSSPSNLVPADPTNPFADYSLDQMYSALSEFKLTRDPGSEFQYSNFGVALLGNVLARREHMTYFDLLKERILIPLHMTHTAISVTPDMTRHMSAGHDASGNVVPAWDFRAFAPAGGLHSNMNDMLEFLSANLRPLNTRLGRAIAASHPPRRVMAPVAGIGLNWLYYTQNGDTAIFAPGETAGFHTYIGFSRQKQMGVVILSNSAVTVNDIGHHLLLDDFPLESPPAWITSHHEVQLRRDQLQKFAGIYEYEGGARVVVEEQNGKLFVVAKWSKWQLHPESADSFFLYEDDEQIKFEKDELGKIVGLIDRTRGTDEHARLIR